MTRGEKIAWIWVWGMFAITLVTAGAAIWRYWALPYIYLEARICETSKGKDAVHACDRILDDAATPDDLRLTTLRRAIALADDQKNWYAVIKRTNELGTLTKANAEDLNLRGIAYYTLRDYTNAAKDFDAATRMDKTVGTYWSNLGDAELELQHYKEALENYTVAITNGNDTPEVRGNRGWVNYQLKDDEKALADYDDAIARDPKHADNLNERGLVRHALHNYDGAIHDYDRSLKIKGENAIVLTNRAITFAEMGKSEEAGADLDRAIALDPNYVLAHREKAWLLINRTQPENALAEIKVIEGIGPLDVYGLEVRSHARLALSDWQGAAADADQAVTLGTTFNWPYQNRQRARRALGNYEGALADGTVLIGRDPKNMELLVIRALTLQLAGRTEMALAEMDQAAKIGTDPAYAYETKAYLNLNAGRIDAAIKDARQSVALFPNSQYSASQLGWVLLFAGEPQAAAQECSRSLSIVPSSGAYACRAMAELAMTQTEAASADANKALDTDPQASIAHLALARIDLTRGKAAEAKQKLDRALKFETFGKAEILMYQGDALRALGKAAEARHAYDDARAADLGLFRKALDERIGALANQ